jgi:hypothetical protein
MSAFYIVDIATEGPATRLVQAKTRAQALAFVAEGTISVRVASAADRASSAKMRRRQRMAKRVRRR